MTLRGKLIIALALASLGGVVASLWAASRFVRRQADERLAEAVAQVGQVLEQQSRLLPVRVQLLPDAMQGMTPLIEALARTNSSDDALGLGSDDSGAALEEAHELFRSAQLPLAHRGGEGLAFLAVTNGQGRLVYSREQPQRRGEALTALRAVREALTGAPTRELWSPGALPEAVRWLPSPTPAGDVLLVFAQPLVRGSSVLGVVLAGQSVQGQLLSEFRRTTAFELVLRGVDGEQTATLAEVPPLPEVLPEGPFVAGRYRAQASPLRDERGRAWASLVVLQDVEAWVERSMAPFRAVSFAIAGVVLGLAVVLAVLTARALSRRLELLGAAARSVRLGELAVTLPPAGGDEVGQLSRAFGEMVEGLKRRDLLDTLFRHYMDPAVVDELIRNPEKAKPGGETRELTIVFADLAGFTALAERVSPEQLLSLLNAYFEDAIEALRAHGGTLDKTMGDGLMCFFGAPLAQGDHAARACRFALALLEVVERASRRFEAAGLGRASVRIGLHTGPCVVGNVGSRKAQSYTVIGDAVNLASRLEGAAKNYAVAILASEATVRAAGDAADFAELDQVRVKGKQAPVRVFRLFPRGARPASVEGYARALLAFRAGRFGEARDTFAAAAPGDASAEAMARVCAAYLAESPTAWDGVRSLEK